MSIHPVDHVPHQHKTVEVTFDSRPRGQGKQAAAVEQPVTDAAIPEQPVDGGVAPGPEPDTVPPPAEDAGTEKTRGVIRLLEAGHFRGVADVRLRINFFDELQARAATAAAPVVAQQSGQLVQTVNGAVDGLLEGLAVDDESREAVNGLVSDFDAAVQAAVEDFNGAGTLDAQALAGTISSAFDSLVEALRGLLTSPVATPTPPPAPEPTPLPEPDSAKVPGTGDLAADVAAIGQTAAEQEVVSPDAVGATDNTPAPEPTEGLEQAWTALTQAFNEALSGFLASITTATQLPEPSPPNGNGGAYDKFMAIYNAMRGQTPPDVDDVG